MLQGKTIGVVYTFEGEDAPGFKHYHYWQGEIIAKWLEAIKQIKCRPYIIDVRTFVEKAISNTLPQIDFILNLNCGGCELSPMAVVPSICAFFHIPCIPCDSVAILAGEDKGLANMAAIANGLQVPKKLESNSPDGLFRPLNLGSSVGVKKGPLTGAEPKGLYQEFINGYDITTPIVYNPMSNSMEFMPTVLYMPNEGGAEWYLGESFKDTRSGFKRLSIMELDDELKHKYISLINSLSINTFCRIDARIKCNSEEELNDILCKPLAASETYFIEVNPMPTVWINNAFSHSFEKLQKNSNIYPYIEKVTNFIGEECSLYTFLLTLSMMEFYNHVQK